MGFSRHCRNQTLLEAQGNLTLLPHSRLLYTGYVRSQMKQTARNFKVENHNMHVRTTSFLGMYPSRQNCQWLDRRSSVFIGEVFGPSLRSFRSVIEAHNLGIRTVAQIVDITLSQSDFRDSGSDHSISSIS